MLPLIAPMTAVLQLLVHGSLAVCSISQAAAVVGFQAIEDSRLSDDPYLQQF